MTRRQVAGVALLALADAAHATALLLLPLWLVHLYAAHAGYGSGLAVGPAVVVLAIALCQPIGRALLMLAGLGAALAVCALAWPLPDWTWLAAFCAGSVLGAGARELTRVRSARLGGLAIGVGIFGLMLARDTLALDDAGQASVQHTLALLVIVGVMLLGWRLTVGSVLGRPSPTLDRLSEWWERWSLRRLASRGLVPLDCDDAPVLYRRVERHPTGGWGWEVRDGQSVLSTGRAARRSKAQRAASRACFARTFSPPHARRPGAVYVLAPVGGNPHTVRVAELLGPPEARHDRSASVGTR